MTVVIIFGFVTVPNFGNVTGEDFSELCCRPTASNSYGMSSQAANRAYFSYIMDGELSYCSCGAHCSAPFFTLL